MRALTVAGIEDIAGAQANDAQEWCDREGIEFAAMAHMIQSALRVFGKKILEDGDVALGRLGRC